MVLEIVKESKSVTSMEELQDYLLESFIKDLKETELNGQKTIEKKLKFRLAFQVVDQNDNPFRPNMSYQECLEVPIAFPSSKINHEHFCDIKDQMLVALEHIATAAQTKYLFAPNQESMLADKNANTHYIFPKHELTIHSFGTQIVARCGTYGDKHLIPHKIQV